jgi:hypothetical protein
MSLDGWLKPLLVATVALNIISAACLTELDDAEEPTATPRPPPRATCTEAGPRPNVVR